MAGVFEGGSGLGTSRVGSYDRGGIVVPRKATVEPNAACRSTLARPRCLPWAWRTRLVAAAQRPRGGWAAYASPNGVGHAATLLSVPAKASAGYTIWDSGLREGVELVRTGTSTLGSWRSWPSSIEASLYGRPTCRLENRLCGGDTDRPRCKRHNDMERRRSACLRRPVFAARCDG